MQLHASGAAVEDIRAIIDKSGSRFRNRTPTPQVPR